MLGFTVGGVRSVGLDRCIWPVSTIIITTQNIHGLQILLCFACSFLPPSPPLATTDRFTVSFSRMSYSWNSIALNPFRLASFTYA